MLQQKQEEVKEVEDDWILERPPDDKPNQKKQLSTRGGPKNKKLPEYKEDSKYVMD